MNKMMDITDALALLLAEQQGLTKIDAYERHDAHTALVRHVHETRTKACFEKIAAARDRINSAIDLGNREDAVSQEHVLRYAAHLGREIDAALFAARAGDRASVSRGVLHDPRGVRGLPGGHPQHHRLPRRGGVRDAGPPCLPGAGHHEQLHGDRERVTMHFPDHVVHACARAAHEANRTYCLAIGDSSQGVVGALAGNTPEQSHEGWMREKLSDGWTYGPVKSPEKKEHPCMVPYAQLPPEQRAKDALFIAVVRAMAEALGWKPAAPAGP